MADSKQQKTNKNRKYGKNLKDPAMIRYIAEGRVFKNRERRLRRHLKKYPEDNVAFKALGNVDWIPRKNTRKYVYN